MKRHQAVKMETLIFPEIALSFDPRHEILMQGRHR